MDLQRQLNRTRASLNIAEGMVQSVLKLARERSDRICELEKSLTKLIHVHRRLPKQDRVNLHQQISNVGSKRPPSPDLSQPSPLANKRPRHARRLSSVSLPYTIQREKSPVV